MPDGNVPLPRMADLTCLPPNAPLAMPRQALHGPAAAAVLRPLPRPGLRVVLRRALALAFSLACAAGAGWLALQYGAGDGLDTVDILRAFLMVLTTWWLAWGAAQAVAGLLAPAAAARSGPGRPLRSRTVILVPVCNEDPLATFARIAAMHGSLEATGEAARFDVAILSDTRDEAVAAEERRWFQRLRQDCTGGGRLFYRRRDSNSGKKAGNIADFLRASGAAWDFALVLDADSLMEGGTIVEMARRMEAEPRLGLLQTLPRVIRAETWFARAMQFSAAHHAPVFARGLAAMQGQAGPFWGHNAMARISAFAQSCGLPDLPGRPPFGGPIYSHDYVEAAMLARAGWVVRLDDDLDGSFEEGPATIVDHARRDRRWAQGNLQHARIIGAAGLAPWHRFTFFQGIFAYAASLFWLAFLALSLWAAATAGPVDFFVENNPIPVFPIDTRGKAVALALAVTALLFLPKLLIALQTIGAGRAAGFGGPMDVLRSTLAEMALSSLTAPVLLMYQARAVVQILLGRDAGWPAQSREGGAMAWRDAWAASGWIAAWGAGGLTLAALYAPALCLWLLPVALPMIAAPAILQLLSRPSPAWVFAVPSETMPAQVLRRYTRTLARWRGTRPAGTVPLAAPKPVFGPPAGSSPAV